MFLFFPLSKFKDIATIEDINLFSIKNVCYLKILNIFYNTELQQQQTITAQL